MPLQCSVALPPLQSLTWSTWWAAGQTRAAESLSWLDANVPGWDRASYSGAGFETPFVIGNMPFPPLPGAQWITDASTINFVTAKNWAWCYAFVLPPGRVMSATLALEAYEGLDGGSRSPVQCVRVNGTPVAPLDPFFWPGPLNTALFNAGGLNCLAIYRVSTVLDGYSALTAKLTLTWQPPPPRALRFTAPPGVPAAVTYA